MRDYNTREVTTTALNSGKPERGKHEAGTSVSGVGTLTLIMIQPDHRGILWHGYIRLKSRYRILPVPLDKYLIAWHGEQVLELGEIPGR